MASNKYWGRIDPDGKLIGKPQTFPPTNLKEGERISFKAVIPHNTGSSPEKFVYEDHITLEGTHILAIYSPGNSVRGSWTITAWGPDVAVVLILVKDALKNLGLC